MDETNAGDTNIPVCRITGYLERMTIVVKELRRMLLDIKQNVDPQFFYERLRPWFGGLDVDPWKRGRTWVFEGRDEVEGGIPMNEVAGVTAGQSSLIQALDIFLGIDVHSPPTSRTPTGKSFSERMRAYMPRYHRAFLTHLGANQRPLRDLVLKATQEGCDAPILEAYNGVVRAVKEWRDAHVIIVTLYIIGPSHRSRARVAGTAIENSGRTLENETEKWMESTIRKKEGSGGRGGADLMKFLKGLRDQTAKTCLSRLV
jgi:indoleamine 2,3-dioxygenase